MFLEVSENSTITSVPIELTAIVVYAGARGGCVAGLAAGGERARGGLPQPVTRRQQRLGAQRAAAGGRWSEP